MSAGDGSVTYSGNERAERERIMTANLDQLREAYQQAEQHAAGLQAERDALQEKVLEARAALRDANENAQAAQNAVCDAEAANALLDRPDGESVARSLGLELPGQD